MNIRIVYIFFILSFCVAEVSAQTSKPPIRRCATMEQDSINRLRFPQRGTLDEFEHTLQYKIREINERKAAGKIQSGVVTIPLVVHIIHNGEAVGTGTNLSQAQVMSQIEVLNEDYRKKLGTPGYNTNPVGADLEIEFCLSPVDENGILLAEPGIDRFKGNKQTWTRQDIDGSLKPTTIWNPNLFYNVWTLKFGGTDSNLLGYAQFPDQSGLDGLDQTGGPSTTDGVVVQYSSFGSADKGNFPVMQAPYNKGRTLSHETGHWLGLRHIWGDGPCANDFVADTPTQQNESRGCPTNKLSCDGSKPAMVQNYMDYSDDACMNIFTNGQKDRMLAVIELSPRRNTLFQANLCSPVVAVAPTANFTTDKKKCVLLGSTVHFTDLSTNFPTAWKWEFEGGDPNTSIERNPKVTYTVVGSYKVKLTATNSIGPSTPLVQENYIVVTAEGLCTQFTNFASGYTPSILPLSDFGSYTGNLTGHNSLNTTAFSELYDNSCGYKFISGAKVNFGQLNYAHEDTKVKVTVWNARGFQHGPGAVIESKDVLLKQIEEDIANNRPTFVTFDRETPVFSLPFHVGVEITYNEDYTLAITSSANGEATNATSWVKKKSGEWKLFTTEYGANIAMDITSVVGAKPSVQVSASKLIVNPGAEVILNGGGASIFVWNADDGSVQNFAGPQLIAHPLQTTTYTITGSGLDLCNSTATAKIYVSGTITAIEEELENSIHLYPNPGTATLNIDMTNDYMGAITIQLYSALGQDSGKQTLRKDTQTLQTTLNTTLLRPGVYLVAFKINHRTIVKKWVKIL